MISYVIFGKRLIVSGLVLSAIFFSSVSCSKYSEMVTERRREEVEKAINEKPEFGRLDKLCREIPLPEGTRFVEKARLYKSVGISYYYYSQNSPEKLEAHFRQFFETNGWTELKNGTKPIGTADFSKDDLEVYTTFIGVEGYSRDRNFSVECEIRKEVK